MRQQEKKVLNSSHILFVSDAFWPFIGGAEQHAFILLSELAKRGFSVCVLSHQFDGTKLFQTIGNLKIWREPLSFSELNLHFFRRIIFYFRSLLAIARYISKSHPDILIAQQLMSIPAIFASKLFHVPIIVTVHDYWPICYYRSLLDSNERMCYTFDRCFRVVYSCVQKRTHLHPIVAATYSLLVYAHTMISRQILDKADRIVVVSRFLKNLLTLSDVDSKKISVIYNPIVAESRVESSSNDAVQVKKLSMPTALYIGRLEAEKGVEFLLQAVKHICAQLRGFKLLIVGNGPLRGQLQFMTKKLGIEDHVEFLGTVSDTALNCLYKSSAVVVVPSIWAEPFGRVVAEALMYNRPVVASNIGAIPEILDEKRGFLVPPRDSKALANAILSAFSRKFSFENDNRAEFSPDHIVEQYISVIRRVGRAHKVI